MRISNVHYDIAMSSLVKSTCTTFRGGGQTVAQTFTAGEARLIAALPVTTAQAADATIHDVFDVLVPPPGITRRYSVNLKKWKAHLFIIRSRKIYNTHAKALLRACNTDINLLSRSLLVLLVDDELLILLLLLVLLLISIAGDVGVAATNDGGDDVKVDAVVINPMYRLLLRDTNVGGAASKSNRRKKINKMKLNISMLIKLSHKV
jgi:hypothetical protein